MRQFRYLFGVVSIMVIALGCGRQQPAAPTAPGAPGKGAAVVGELPNVAVAPPGKAPEGGVHVAGHQTPGAPETPAAREEQFEAALSDALGLLADQKWSQAMEAFEAARRFNDSDFVRGEIAKLKVRMEQEAAADRTVRDIETILAEGKPQDAARLAQDALREFGGGDVAGQLVKLRLQADALHLAGANEAAEQRYQRYRAEGESALKEQNLRAAALAFEQAVQAREDARVRQQLDEVRGRLARYDDLRRRAAEMRRDAQQLEEAVAALNEAAEAWDTLQVRQEIDEYTLALERRRDNLSVATFEVQGEIGYPDAGRIVAEELLPHFKARFDLVERGQLGKVIQELKLEESFIDDSAQQQELARLAKVRYLVVGSVRRLGGVTVSARLVDARTGLIAQTGKVAAATVDDAVALLPELAKQLMMSDDEKLAYDERRARLAQRITPPADDAPLPPPPAAAAPNVAAPPPFVFQEPPPVEFAGVTIDHFKRLPAPPVVGVKIIAPPPPEPVLRHRMLHAALQLGDDAFVRGRYHEAHRHFDLALNLSPGDFNVRLRLERVTPFLPAPRPVVVTPVVIAPVAPVFVAKPRLVVLDFVTFGDPFVVPPHWGRWTAYQLAPYFRARYDIVDPAEVHYFMGRLGMSMRDVMEDAHARRWLGRALGARYFMVGTLAQTASFDVTTYVLDAEFGYLHNSAKIHVHNRPELRLRLGELAHLTMLDPVERNRWLADEQRFAALLLRGRQHHDRREFALAIGVFEDALRMRPGHVELMVHLTNSRRQAQLLAFEEARRQAFLRQQALAAEAARRQLELARAAELARIRAVQEASLRAEADRRAFEQQRLLAHQQLMGRARIAIKTDNFTLALDLFKGAADLVPPQPVVVGFTPQADLLREMALARAHAEKSAQARVATQVAVRENALRVQREKELAVVKQKLISERQKEAAVEAAQLKAQEERDRLLYQSSFDDGQRFMSQGKYDAALASLQAARRVKSTPAVEQMIAMALQNQALAKAKDAGERKDLEAKLTAERERRRQAEADAKRNQELYQSALERANQALAQRQYDVAHAKYEEAGKLFRTDAVLTGLRRVDAARAEQKQKTQGDQEKSKRVQQLLADGRAAFQAKQYAKAVDSYRTAKKIAPDNLDVLAGLTQAEQAQEKLGAEARRKTEDAERQQNFARLLKSGQENLKAKQYDAAVVALSEAVKLNPSDASAKAALASAEAGRKQAAIDVKAGAAAKQKTEAYQKLLTDGRLALQAKRYDDAIKSFGEAQKLLPGDKTSARFLDDAKQAKADQDGALAAAAKKRADELQRAADLQKALKTGRTALAAKDFAAAGKALNQADKLAPGNQEVQTALRDLDQAQKLAKQDGERDAQFDAALRSGEKALKAKDFKEAVRALQQATRLRPSDQKATSMLEFAQRELRKSGAPVGDNFDAVMSAGRKALVGKQYPEAIRAFQDAVKMRPNDPQAARLLQQAQVELKDAGKTPAKKQDDPPGDRKRFTQLMQTGQKALDDKKYDDAVKAFRAASQLMPDDPQATRLLRQAQKLVDAKTPDTKKKKAG